MWISLNPGEVNSNWWENNSHGSSLWHHQPWDILPFGDYGTCLSNQCIVTPISVLHWLPFITGTHWHDLRNVLVSCLFAVCPTPSLLLLRVVGTFPEMMRILITLCSGLSLYILKFPLAVLHVAYCLNMGACIAHRILPNWIHRWTRGIYQTAQLYGKVMSYV